MTVMSRVWRVVSFRFMLCQQNSLLVAHNSLLTISVPVFFTKTSTYGENMM
jgi:hypothetical protein